MRHLAPAPQPTSTNCKALASPGYVLERRAAGEAACSALCLCHCHTLPHEVGDRGLRLTATRDGATHGKGSPWAMGFGVRRARPGPSFPALKRQAFVLLGAGWPLAPPPMSYNLHCITYTVPVGICICKMHVAYSRQAKPPTPFFLSRGARCGFQRRCLCWL
jgi:hypothetical protein